MAERIARADVAETKPTVVRFGAFELDPSSGELKRNGRRVPLQDQPARALCLLVSRSGHVVTRDELRHALWSADTYLEFDTALNIVINKVRHAIGDVAASPRFIETIPKRGYRFVADVRDVAEAMSGPLSGAGTGRVEDARRTDGGDPSARVDPPHIGRGRYSRLLVGALLVVATVAMAGRLWQSMREARPGGPAVMNLEVNLGPDVSLRSGPGPSVALSPNGERLVFVSGGSLITRRLNQRDSTVLAGTDGATSFFFSPDSESLAFVAHGKLKKLFLDGGSIVTITDAPEARGGSWADDGTMVIAGVSGGLMRVPSKGGAAELLTRLEPHEFTHRWPQFLPGGRALLFTSNTAPTWWSHARVEVLSLADGRRKRLQDHAAFGRFAADANGNGYLTFVRNGVLLAAPFDPIRLELTGEPFGVLDNLAYDNTGAAHVDVSRTGTIIARPQTRLRLAWLDASGAVRLFGEPANYEAPALSRDGNLVAYSAAGDLWVYDVARDVRTQVTKGLAVTRPKHWTSDDRSIVFSTPEGIWRVQPDGGADPELVVPAAPSRVRVASSSALVPGGIRLAFHEVATGNASKWDLWTILLDGAGRRVREPESLLATQADERESDLSPDGRWVAYSASETDGRFDIFVRAFPDAGRQWKVSAGGGVYPRWCESRSMLFFVSDGLLMAVPYSVNDMVFTPARPRLWSRQPLAAEPGPNPYPYAVSADGQRIVAVVPDPASEEYSRRNVTLWVNALSDFGRRIGTGH